MRALRWVVGALMLAAMPVQAAEEPQSKGSGLLELSMWQGVNGVSLAAEMNNARNAGVESGVIFGTIGLLAGTTLPTFLTPDVTTGQAMAINLGGQLGALNGVAATHLVQDGTGGRYIAAGQLMGTLGGALLAQGKPPEVGRIALAQSMALWLSLATTLAQASHSGDQLIAATIAADVGALAGYWLWPSLPLSRGSLRAFDCAAGIGLVAGALAAVANNNREETYARSSLVGLGVGAAVGVAIVYVLEHEDAPKSKVTLQVLPTAGGAMLSLGGRL